MFPVSISKPHHKQEHDTSCLAACAKMLLNFLGESIEEKTLYSLLRTTDRGTTVTNVLMLNASLSGIKAELHEWLFADLQEYLETKQQPCIVTVGTSPLPHWEQIDSLHAIIVHGFDDEHIFINDPFFDDREFRIVIDDFLAAWSEAENFAITIERR